MDHINPQTYIQTQTHSLSLPFQAEVVNLVGMIDDLLIVEMKREETADRIVEIFTFQWRSITIIVTVKVFAVA